MAAIITDDFRKNNIENFIADVGKAPTPIWTADATFAEDDLVKHGTPLRLYKSTANSNTNNSPATATQWQLQSSAGDEDTGGTDYYIGIGKTDPWLPNANGTVETEASFTVPNPTGSIIEKADIKKNLITLVKIDATDCLRLAPQVPFQTGRIYKVYDPTDPTCFDADPSLNIFPCYAMTQDGQGNRKTFVCLANNNGAPATQNIPSLLPRTVNYPYGVDENSDNYIWAYVDFFDKTTSNLFSDSLTFFNITPDNDVDTRMNNVSGHGDGSSDSGDYDNGRQRAAQATAGLLYGFKINPSQKGAGYPINRTGVNAINAKIVGKRLKDNNPTDTIGDTFQSADDAVKVETNNQGEVERILWTLADAQALGYGIADVPKSDPLINGNHNTSTVVGDGGILEASLIIDDSSFSNGANFVEADIQPLIAPKHGFGFSPLEDLPSYYCGISADFKGTVGDDADAPIDGSPPQYVAESLVDIDFRQVSLLRDSDSNMSLGEDDLNSSGEYPDSDLGKEKAMNCLQYIQVGGEVPNNLAINLDSGAYLVMDNGGGTGESPMAWVDKVSRFEAADPEDTDGDGTGEAAGGYRIYYHQNSDKRINQIPLVIGRTFEVFDNTGSSKEAGITAANILQGEYKQNSGEVMFVDNRAPIRRNAQQTEEVRLIIQF